MRKKYNIYLSDEESEIIKHLVARVSPIDKNKPIGQIIRRGILAIACNPDLDFIFDPGVCLNLTVSEIKLRELLYVKMIENIDVLKRHGVLLPSEYTEGGDSDGSEHEATEEDS